MRYLLPLLMLVACTPKAVTTQIHHPVQKPAFEAPAEKPVEKPAPKLMEPMHRPEPVTKEAVRQAQQWLLFMTTNLGKGLEEAQSICAFMGSQLELQDEGGPNMHWMNCGGADGYSMAVNDGGEVQFVVDANHPSWRLDILTKLLGEPELDKDQDLSQYRWVRPANDAAGPDLVISYCVSADPDKRPFVSVQFAADPAKPSKSGATLNL